MAAKDTQILLEIGELRGELRAFGKRMVSYDHAINGNGKAGLKSDMATVKEWVVNHEDTAKTGWAKIATTAALGLSACMLGVSILALVLTTRQQNENGDHPSFDPVSGVRHSASND